MAIELIEGWDEFGSDVASKYGGNTGSTASPGRNGIGRCISVGNSDLVMPIPANARYTVGFAFTLANLTTDVDLVRLREGTTIHGTLSYVAASNQLQVSRNGSIPALSGLLPLRAGVWNFVELDYAVHDSTGAWEVRLNDVAVIGPTSGLDTRNGGTGVIDNLYVVAQGGNTRAYDDMYFASGTTSFLGDGRVITSMPTGDGGNTAWTPNTGSRWAAVDEVPHSSDTDYISNGTSGQRDTFTFAALGITGTIKAVVLGLVARKDDAGTRQVKSTVRRGSTNYDGSVVLSLPTTYQRFDGDVMTVDPSDSGAWTVADVDASEFGVVTV